jgi:hypothetical protein
VRAADRGEEEWIFQAPQGIATGIPIYKQQKTRHVAESKKEKLMYPNFMTADDVQAYKGQKKSILHELAVNFGENVTTERLEEVSGSKRVAARIHLLRDDMWDIEMGRQPNRRRGMYRLLGKASVRQKIKHCPSCECDLVTSVVQP